MRVIDLSVALEAGIASDPPGMLPEIEYRSHAQGAEEFEGMFPGLRAESLPEGQDAAVERLRLTTHNGTHLDAPWHFHSTMNGGEGAWTIDEVPLEWCLGEGVKLDFRHLPDGAVATARDVEEELARIGHALRPFDIVLVNTAAAAAYGQPHFLNAGCGMGRHEPARRAAGGRGRRGGEGQGPPGRAGPPGDAGGDPRPRRTRRADADGSGSLGTIVGEAGVTVEE